MCLCPEIAFACGHHHSKSIRQTAAQTNACENGIMSSDINCQNLDNQVDRDHNADNVKGIRPSSSFDVIAHANDDYNGHNNRHNDHVSSPWIKTKHGLIMALKLHQ